MRCVVFIRDVTIICIVYQNVQFAWFVSIHSLNHSILVRFGFSLFLTSTQTYFLLFFLFISRSARSLQQAAVADSSQQGAAVVLLAVVVVVAVAVQAATAAAPERHRRALWEPPLANTGDHRWPPTSVLMTSLPRWRRWNIWLFNFYLIKKSVGFFNF